MAGLSPFLCKVGPTLREGKGLAQGHSEAAGEVGLEFVSLDSWTIAAFILLSPLPPSLLPSSCSFLISPFSLLYLFSPLHSLLSFLVFSSMPVCWMTGPLLPWDHNVNFKDKISV